MDSMGIHIEYCIARLYVYLWGRNFKKVRIDTVKYETMQMIKLEIFRI